MTQIVIVGASHAGFQLAASLRQLKHAGPITIIGEERGLPYHRPPLSKEFLAGTMAEDALRLRPASFYEKANVTLRDGVRVAAIDRAARRAVLTDGETLAYDHLVLATGARHRVLPIPGAGLHGVLALRTRAEAAALRARLAEARDVVIVGAGFIGLEVACVAEARRARVTILEMAPRPLARAVSRPMSDALAALHRTAGADLRTGVSARAFVGEAGHVAAVEISDRARIAADLVVVGIGVVPNVELAAEAGLATENGILVDETLRTADPAISAIGDCAAFPSPFTGGVVRLESIQNAQDHARCVAARLCGRPEPYRAVPWFWSDQGRQKLEIAGLTADHDHTVLRGDPASGAFSVFCFRDEKLLGVESLNRSADHMAARRLLAAAVALTPAQAEDTGFDIVAA